jgi:hypothetical protein
LAACGKTAGCMRHYSMESGVFTERYRGKQMEPIELKSAISDLSARVEKIRDWL